MSELEKQLKKKILILDGAMGTMLQRANLTAHDFGGEQYEGCNDYLNLTVPHVIEQIHGEYLAAGADIIETNTFGATRIVLSDYGLAHLAYDINYQGARIARKMADKYSAPGFPRFVAGSMGPTSKSLSVTGGITFKDLQSDYYQQALALIQGGVDLLLVETCQDTLNVKAACLGIKEAFKTLNIELPIVISGTIEPNGTTFAGQSIEAFYISVQHFNPLAVGLNCATGPDLMGAHLRSLADLASTYVCCYPNAGLPDEEGHYHETPEKFADKVAAFAEQGWLNIVGGCCGTTPEHIEALAKALSSCSPRVPKKRTLHTIAGLEALIYDRQTMRPLLVGERSNVIGSRKFKELISTEQYEEAAEIARNQAKNGAHVIDVCLANPERNEKHDMEQFLKILTKKVKLPIMIDSIDPEVINVSMEYIQGKSIINSINLEEGEARFREVAQIAKQFGAAVVIGLIDEKGMAITVERKIEIAQRAYSLLVNDFGLNPQDLIFDPLVFPVGTGEEKYLEAAKNTIEGIRQIKKLYPECQTILGISNVSFGLPPAGREILNSVFLYHCTQAGLDYAIVNTEKLSRLASISPEEIQLAEQLLFHTSPETLNQFNLFYRDKKASGQHSSPPRDLPLPQRLARYVVEGRKNGLAEDLELALKEYPNPLDIINGPLMEGMDEVGRLFKQNQLIVAEVLQSAEVMKAAVSYLQPYMKEKEVQVKGKVLLATVKGDVHDIGKNLVDIIFSNNGFKIVDLGIKVSSGELIEKVKTENPQIIGLSGLLVKSAQQMILTVQDLAEANISIPVIVGGAALTSKFVKEKIAPAYGGKVFYAKDAMAGLFIANEIIAENQLNHDYSSAQNSSFKTDQFDPQSNKYSSKAQASEQEKSAPNASSKQYTPNVPPDYNPHILKFEPAQIRPYINLQMLLGHHLGLKGSVAQKLESRDEKALKLYELITALLAQAERENLLQPAVKYQFFPAQSVGNDVLIYDPTDSDKVLERFSFPRQTHPPYLSIPDFISSAESGIMDGIAFVAATVGDGIQRFAHKLKEEGRFLECHALQALALQSAEATLEKAHQLIRELWGFPDPPEMTMEERLAAKYRGQRFSFGYPACPNLEDQIKLFRLLRPEEIGITLTEGLMMNPEASVSAFITSHPKARYFAVC